MTLRARWRSLALPLDELDEHFAISVSTHHLCSRSLFGRAMMQDDLFQVVRWVTERWVDREEVRKLFWKFASAKG